MTDPTAQGSPIWSGDQTRQEEQLLPPRGESAGSTGLPGPRRCKAWDETATLRYRNRLHPSSGAEAAGAELRRRHGGQAGLPAAARPRAAIEP